MEHTKTPWKISNEIGKALIESDDLEPICDMFWNTNEMSRANAAFIVKACNMHGKLIAMLKRLIMEANQNGITNETFDDAESMLDEAEAE